MTEKQKAFRKSLLAQIHMEPLYKVLANAGIWGKWLNERFYVTSCKDLAIEHLIDVLALLRRSSERYKNIRDPKAPTKKQANLIADLLDELDMSLADLEKLTWRVCKVRTNALTKEQAVHLILALKNMVKVQQQKLGNLAINDPNYVPSYLKNQ
ncbi:phage protein GemA/Gp16 family protein [Helicobacter suis]|uniref:phage protein GemA/Gp16 family protein n=1 Tax=Helicobacter suis TaxID=104628 RepID=UPI0013D7EC2D|nr:phage protein GemA/Gp16 family protein [Helicobacter suis]